MVEEAAGNLSAEERARACMAANDPARSIESAQAHYAEVLGMAKTAARELKDRLATEGVPGRKPVPARRVIPIRASSIGDLFDCAARWEAKHIRGMRMPKSGKAQLGTAIHKSTGLYDQSKLDGAGPQADDCTGAAGGRDPQARRGRGVGRRPRHRGREDRPRAAHEATAPRSRRRRTTPPSR
jgi:hypothetical protein